MGNCFKKEILCTRQELSTLTKREFNELCHFVIIKITNKVEEEYKNIRLNILNDSEFHICGTDFLISDSIKEKLKK